VKDNTATALCLMLSVFLFLGLWVTGSAVGGIRKRLNAIERIIGTEAPASMTYTNGHIYTTLVKHSWNCPCVEKK